MKPNWSRREFLATLAPVPSGAARVRRITTGPKYHWFGYYDKLQFDLTGRYVLGMEVDFEHRSPRPDDVIRVGMVDLEARDRWIELGSSRAWNWQQGCMLQWLPEAKDEVIWNDREGGRFVAHILNVRTGKRRTIPAPIYTLSPDGTWAVAPDFRRLNDCRPGYGYAGLPDPNANILAPDDAGIWRVDLRTGKQRLLLSFADALKVPNPHGDWTGAKHWFNHLLIAPDGNRFIFLHRWRGKKEGTSFATRMITADRDGRNLYVVDPYGRTSHFIWRDASHILAWAWHPSRGDKFYLYEDRSERVEAIGSEVMTRNGHCTYLPGNRWIVNDAYPDKERNQPLYLYEVATGRAIELGRFHSPAAYTGEWRCDLHPRSSPDGTKICIDSPHEGGRQMYLIDVPVKP
jgi:hypothetical protein